VDTQTLLDFCCRKDDELFPNSDALETRIDNCSMRVVTDLDQQRCHFLVGIHFMLNCNAKRQTDCRMLADGAVGTSFELFPENVRRVANYRDDCRVVHLKDLSVLVQNESFSADYPPPQVSPTAFLWGVGLRHFGD
jgi:hypothetical protein